MYSLDSDKREDLSGRQDLGSGPEEQVGNSRAGQGKENGFMI